MTARRSLLIGLATYLATSLALLGHAAASGASPFTRHDQPETRP